MGLAAGPGRPRVLVPQALGADEFLRVTWHRERDVVVFSHWQGARCVAATPVRIDDLDELNELLGVALATRARRTWPAPDPDTLVVPAHGFSLPTARCVA